MSTFSSFAVFNIVSAVSPSFITIFMTHRQDVPWLYGETPWLIYANHSVLPPGICACNCILSNRPTVRILHVAILFRHSLRLPSKSLHQQLSALFHRNPMRSILSLFS